MSRYDDDYVAPNARQRDLVLSTNEFCFVQSQTNGAIKTYTGPTTVTISQQESLVIFNKKTKRFEETQDFEKARQLFVSAPESWYVVLKNPAGDESHPEPAKAENAPALQIGHKVNIAGPVSFSLYPGQMAKVVRGHRLRSNQYLLARVYDAEAAEVGMNAATIIDAEGNESDTTGTKYYAGQLLVIKGTEVSFYIPPTGIEVIPVGGKGNDYVRDAVTLERLEYAILKDEDGEKRYVHGPAVVFPEPTETFVETPKGGTIFRALELSPISGIYIKVIADYTDDEGTYHPIGEELFITGNDQMIYYPRTEHAMIQYDGRYMHHAIAIPEGEGRYIMNRLTGEIQTVKGPKMYLPDPRTEVVVKRKLTDKECAMMFPNNGEVLDYNRSISEQATQRMANKGITNSVLDTLYSTSNQEATLAIFEANAAISRGTSYTKPRTITLDTKYDGVVGIDVWTGYAVNVVSRTGKREVVVGPTTRLLDYDETLEAMELSTGKPKTTDKLIRTAYLRIENNKISDLITVQTNDFVDVTIKVSYCVDFLTDYKDKWFSVENYVKFLCDRQKSLLKREAKQYNIEEFYANITDIVRNIALNLDENGEGKGRLFTENGMLVKDVEVLSVCIDSEIEDEINRHQQEIIEKNLELSKAKKEAEVIETLARYEQEQAKLDFETKAYKLQLKKDNETATLQAQEELRELKRAQEKAQREAEQDMQAIFNAISAAELERRKQNTNEELRREAEENKLLAARQEAYAQTVKGILDSIQPGLIEALTAKANANLLETATENMSAYALANNEGVAETVDKLLRGTTLEGVLTNIANRD